MTGRDFDALPAAEKERIYQEIESTTPGRRRAASRPPSAAGRARLKRVRAKMGRPVSGEGAQTICLTVEKGLLGRADAFANAKGISRAQLVAQGLLSVIGIAAPKSVAAASQKADR